METNSQRHGLPVTDAGGLRIIEVVCAAAPLNPFREWVEEGVVELIDRLRVAVPDPASEVAEPVRVAVVVKLPTTTDPWESAAADALGEATRGVVGVLTLEFGARVRVNTVLTRDPGDVATRDTMDFLSSDRAAFVAGSTFDLRGA
jgi:hypothetical protein